jgi:hypothetical protein
MSNQPRPIPATSEDIAAARAGKLPERLAALSDHPVPLTTDEIRAAREGIEPTALRSRP